MRALGPRFLVEAIFLVVVALVAGLAGLRWTAIILVMVLAYLLVVVFEVVVARAGVFPGQDALRRRRVEEPPVVEPSPPMPEPQHVHVIPREPDPAAQPVLERRHEPEPEPELEPPPAPEPVPPVLEPLLAEPTPEPVGPPLIPEPAPEPPEPEPEPEPEPLPEPEPEPEPAPPLEVVPPPPPEPEPEPEPVAAEPERVVRLPVPSGPREWNLWELERLVRAHAGDDVALDEERSYLLVYLRDFATPEGTLPSDFDGLVRESFGELLAAAR